MWILICNGRLVASGLLCFCCISVVIYMLCKKYIILCHIIYKVVTSLLCFFWLQSPNDAIIQLRFVFAWEIPKITPWSNLFSTGNYLLKTMSEEHVMDLELTQSIKFRKKMYSLRWSSKASISIFFEKTKLLCGLVGNCTTVVWII